jgi:hypothetical protein
MEKELTAKERVQFELDELNQKIGKLSAFLFGSAIIEKKDISNAMKGLLKRQLAQMQDYAQTLQERLEIWGKTDEELRAL